MSAVPSSLQLLDFEEYNTMRQQQKVARLMAAHWGKGGMGGGAPPEAVLSKTMQLKSADLSCEPRELQSEPMADVALKTAVV